MKLKIIKICAINKGECVVPALFWEGAAKRPTPLFKFN